MTRTSGQIDKLLEIDSANARFSLSVLRDFDERLPQVLDRIADMFDSFGECTEIDAEGAAAVGALSDIAKKKGLSGDELVQAIEAKEDRDGEIERARHQMAVFTSRGAMTMLTLLTQRHYLWAATDFRRLRVTSALAHVRLQAECVGLLLLFRDDALAARDWLRATNEVSGKKFHQRYNAQIRYRMQCAGVLEAYNASSGMAQHARLGSLLLGFSHALHADRDQMTLTLTEWNEERADMFFNIVLWFLRIQERAFRGMLMAFPSAHQDFISKVDALGDQIAVFYDVFHQQFPGFADKFGDTNQLDSAPQSSE